MAFSDYNAGSTPQGVIIAGGVSASGAPTQGSLQTKSAQRTNLGFQQITVLTASTAPTVPGGATYAVVQAEAQAIRWRDDGVAPTASVGMTIPAGGELRYDGSLAALRLIEVAASAKANITYYS